LYYERYHPELTTWWWENRVDFFAPDGWVDATIYNAGGYEAYRNAVYLRGAHFYADLRQAMGDEAFFAFLKAFARDRAYGIATAANFADLARQFTSADLAPIFQTYFQNPP
jgi:aminopeptidase N